MKNAIKVKAHAVCECCGVYSKEGDGLKKNDCFDYQYTALISLLPREKYFIILSGSQSMASLIFLAIS